MRVRRGILGFLILCTLLCTQHAYSLTIAPGVWYQNPGYGRISFDNSIVCTSIGVGGDYVQLYDVSQFSEPLGTFGIRTTATSTVNITRVTESEISFTVNGTVVTTTQVRIPGKSSPKYVSGDNGWNWNPVTRVVTVYSTTGVHSVSLKWVDHWADYEELAYSGYDLASLMPVVFAAGMVVTALIAPEDQDVTQMAAMFVVVVFALMAGLMVIQGFLGTYS